MVRQLSLAQAIEVFAKGVGGRFAMGELEVEDGRGFESEDGLGKAESR